MIISTDCGLSSNSPPTPRGGKGAPAGGTGGGKDGQHTAVGSRLHVTTTDSRTGQINLGDGGGHRLASWTSGYATARSEAICRGAGCGRTRTSGSVGGQGQQRPWSTRPRNVLADLTIESNRFDVEPELTAKLLLRGTHILEVPISYVGRTHSEGKKISWVDFVSAVWILGRLRVWGA